MHETQEDIEKLQSLLDASYAVAGAHLRSIHTKNWRMSAQDVVDTLTGMVVLNLATVNSRCEPIQGPVDGQFYRGHFYCGSAPNSIRALHIRPRPQVSASHVRGEELAVIVHGTAEEVDRTSDSAQGYRAVLADIYGEEAIEGFWSGDAVYWKIVPRKMFALAPKIDSA